MPYANNCRCLNCDEITDCAHGADFANRFKGLRFCSSCGESDGFYDSVEKWVSTANDWKPWTWLNGHWEKVNR